MNIDEAISEAYNQNYEALRNLKKKCEELTRKQTEYSQKGLKPDPRAIAQALGIPLEDYFKLDTFVKGGEYEEVCNSVIEEDFRSGAEVIPNSVYPNNLK